MCDFVSLWQGGPLFAQSEHFRLGTDSVLLADFVTAERYAKGIDLGCGSGILPLLLLVRAEKLRMTGLEINPDAARFAEANLRENGLSSRGRIVTGDIRDHRRLFASGEFDLVVSNPPYFAEGSGAVSPRGDRAAARGELLCTLEDTVSAAAYLCRTGGAFFMVHRAERLTDVLCLLRKYGLEPKKLRTVSHSAEKEPSLILIEARRGGGPGLRILPALYLRNADGSETGEILRIYHREERP
ncbi:MAG: methyltransferase [Oscillospiraceae bacterium]|nr:methyltransferase [Oscillospiraceae bacterium]